jgi:hypothetical protein
MLSFNGNLRVYVALEPCDMRKSFNGLSMLVSETLQADPLSGAAFLFTNKRRNLIKILYWDGTGFWVVANSHAPQCPFWFIHEDPVSVPPTLRRRLRGLRCRRRQAGHGIHPAR